MNKKWLIGIVVVVALGVLTYLGTSTDLFKGSLGKGGEKGGLPAVTEARCNELQKWYDQGILSAKIKGAIPYQLACMRKYGKLFPSWISQDSCTLVSDAYKQGGNSLPPPPPVNMGPDYPVESAEHKELAEYMCWLKYPSLWTKNPPTQKGEPSPQK